jgi:hypothetical protein
MPSRAAHAPRRRGRSNRALWSLYFHAHGLGPSLLSAGLRPLPLDDAVNVLAEPGGVSSGASQWTALRLLHAAAGVPLGQLRDLCTRPRAPRIDVNLELNLLLSVLPIAEATLRGLIESLVDTRPFCVLPDCRSTYLGQTRTIIAVSQVTVKRPYGEVCQRIDPRNWQRCGEVFRKTQHVQSVGGRYYPPAPTSSQPGKPWRGLLYEHVQTGPVASENVLDIDFKVGAREATVDFSLHHPLAYRFGPLEWVGGVQIDSGQLTAKRLEPVERGETLVTATKKVRFRDLTPGDPGLTVDYGDLVSYLAPASLCMWLDDVSAIVPCCP